MPLVYVSFARESAAHVAAVIEFASLLRNEGIDARIAEWHRDQRHDEVAWLTEMLATADFIVVIASPEHRRMLDQVITKPGDLAHYEAAQIRNVLARDPEAELRRILPVVLPGNSVEDIPDILRGYSTSHYVIDEISADGIAPLHYLLNGTSPDAMPPLRRPFLPPIPPDQAIVVPAIEQAEDDGTLTIGDRTYLAHGKPEPEPSADGAASRREVRALRLGPPHEPVWLRQVVLAADTPSARKELRAPRLEYELLSELAGRSPGLPRPLELVEEERRATVIIGWPVTGARRDPCDPLTDFLPLPGDPFDSWRAATACQGLACVARALSALHATGHTHRRLSPAALIRHDDRTYLLRDLGDAGRPSRPGEGPPDYLAPEQQRRHRGPIGAWTDVFQLAAIAYHLVTGYPPEPGSPLPVRGLPPLQADAIDTALLPDPDRRPDMDRFADTLADIRTSGAATR